MKKSLLYLFMFVQSACFQVVVMTMMLNTLLIVS